MSDTMAALLIVPFLIALVVVLECTRTGCTWLHRRYRAPRTEQASMPQMDAVAEHI